MIAAVSLTLAAAVHFRVIGGADYTEGLVVDQLPLSLNPLIGAEDPAVHDVGHLLYRPLLQLDATQYPRPDLAQSLSVSADGLTYSMALGPSQRWSDGTPITPSDVAATLAFAQSSRAVDHPLAVLLQGVKVTVQRSSIVFILPAPRASFAAALTQLPILPLGTLTNNQLDSVAANPNRPLATSGPYRVASADSGSIQLETNSYAAVRPGLGHIAFNLYGSFNDAANAFISGGVDALVATTPAERAQLLGAKGATAHDIATFQFVDLLFNERVPGLNDPTVRQAFNIALNRASIVHGALRGTGGVMQMDAISQGLPWIATKNAQELASPAAANTALQQDGWTAGLTGSRFRGAHSLDFVLTVADADPLPTVAAELAAQMAQVGIKLTVETVPAARFVSPDVTNQDFQIALGDWDNGPDPDISAFWRSNAVPPQGFYVSGGATDPFLDQALDSLATAMDPQARIAAAASVNRDLANDVPAVFLYTPDVSYVVRKPLQGMVLPAAGGSGARFDSIAAWHP